MQWTPYGPKAVLIRFGVDGDAIATSARARAIAAASKNDAPRAVAELTIAFDQVLVEFRNAEAFADAVPEILDWLGTLDPVPEDQATRHEIPVAYDGEDLEEVAERHGLSVGDVIARHAAASYEVAMLGFSPGFPYLNGLDQSLWTPRRAVPRAVIRAGAIAIGGSHAGIYSVASPGGWNVIGHTTVRIFDPARRNPDGDEAGMFLLRTGDRVRFVPLS